MTSIAATVLALSLGHFQHEEVPIPIAGMASAGAQVSVASGATYGVAGALRLAGEVGAFPRGPWVGIFDGRIAVGELDARFRLQGDLRWGIGARAFPKERHGPFLRAVQQIDADVRDVDHRWYVVDGIGAEVGWELWPRDHAVVQVGIGTSVVVTHGLGVETESSHFAPAPSVRPFMLVDLSTLRLWAFAQHIPSTKSGEASIDSIHADACFVRTLALCLDGYALRGRDAMDRSVTSSVLQLTLGIGKNVADSGF